MYINPKYADRYSQAAEAPGENGQRLATLDRSGKDAREELRVTLAEYNGHPYVSMRVWALSNDGQWWPVKSKGCSVRISECGDVAAALKRAEQLAHEHAGTSEGYGQPSAPRPHSGHARRFQGHDGASA